MRCEGDTCTIHVQLLTLLTKCTAWHKQLYMKEPSCSDMDRTC